MTNGERIKYLREKNGFTQKDIANKLGMEPAAISKYELDMREPNIEALKKLSSIFNVSIDYLLGQSPYVLTEDFEIDTVDLSMIQKKYNLLKKRNKNLKEEYINKNSINIALNELHCSSGTFSYGNVKTNSIIPISQIDALFEDLENSKSPKPQIMIKLKNIENSVIIVEIDSFDDDEMPINSMERLALYTAKLSKEYNVFGLAISIEKDEDCKLIDAIYQKNNDSYFTQLHLPQTVLTVSEYVDIMGRL